MSMPLKRGKTEQIEEFYETLQDQIDTLYTEGKIIKFTWK